MSGLAGILRLDRAPVDPAALAPMLDALEHRGAEAPRTWVRGPVGLGHRQRRTSPASRHEVQPLLDPDEQVCLTLDGRVDNAADVLAALGPDRERVRDASHAELVLQAYLRWGRAAFARIVGDFAVVLWDERALELVAVRDPLFKRPLYYLHDRRPGVDAFRWGSEIVAVLADRGIRREPNLGMVAEHLAVSVTSTTDTVFAGVQRVPPGHALVVGLDGRTALEPTWTWDPASAVRRTGTTPAQDAAHVEEFLHVFGTAVRSHLDTDDPIAAQLSGGVDSSSVVGMAHHLLQEAGRPPLELYSLVFPGHRFDESAFVHDVADHVGATAHEYTPAPQGAAFFEADLRRTLEPPDPPNFAMHREHLLDARARGCQVLLTGQGGDEWLSGSPYALADDLRHLRLRGLRGRLRDDRQLWPARTLAHKVVRDGILPMLGRAHLPPPHVELLTPSFRSSVGLEDRLRWRPDLSGPSTASSHLAGHLAHGETIYSAERAEQAFGAVGIERRGPLEDRRMVELALRLPDDVRRRGLAAKWIVRKAMDGLVPDSVRQRGWKSGFGHLLPAELEAQGGAALFDDLAIVDLGWVDGKALKLAYEDVRAAHLADRGHEFTWSVWNTLWTDRWYRAMFSA